MVGLWSARPERRLYRAGKLQKEILKPMSGQRWENHPSLGVRQNKLEQNPLNTTLSFAVAKKPRILSKLLSANTCVPCEPGGSMVEYRPLSKAKPCSNCVESTKVPTMSPLLLTLAGNVASAPGTLIFVKAPFFHIKP